ncbi:RIP metalloprotease RseP [Montanilutibacter psychrotolerans]|uniref:Zinc metalloprotease n=1 Tax=Montanilutibacter psychrotolerans TaxID=1327343 RepID=A0A3M8SK97_9GAMM|nr:RIP metalloprotease RseP [Lysobacter psychrotolerans]RNF81711.1 RIP metalloprotease RseP [Lysobacter psychrotolerans]
MSELLGSIWWLLVSIGVLVTIHEYGHYWVARRCGVKVLRFSIGFGPALWMRRGQDGTEYAIAAIPLGGYVRMLDEREGDVAASELAFAFNRQSVWKRIAIVLAGPVANLLLCVALFWGMFVIGRPDFVPVVGQAKGLAAAGGLQPGDQILAVGARETPTWSEANMALITAALDRTDVPLRIRSAGGVEGQRQLPLSRLPATFDERNAIAVIGLTPRHRLVPAVIGAVVPGKPAWGVLAEGDRVTAIDGTPIAAWDDITPLVQRLGNAGGTAMVEVQRKGERLALELQPVRARNEAGTPYWQLGIDYARPSEPVEDTVRRYGPLQAVPAALGESVHQTRELFAMIGRAFAGRVSVRNTVAGPITIGRAANSVASHGPAWYLQLLAMLSLSLGILNLLPIPILDGGHLLYYLIELAKGSPVSERVMAAGQYVGLALIASLMGLAFFNDIVNNLVN